MPSRKQQLDDLEQAMVYQEEQANTIILVVVIVAIGLVAWAGVAWWMWRGL